MLGLTLEWIDKQGGVEAMNAINKCKSRMVYDVVENSHGFYQYVSVSVCVCLLANLGFFEKFF